MRDTEFAELVTLAIESLKEETVFHLLQSDAKYQRECEEEGFVEKQYLQLDLTKHQRAVCNQLIDCRDKQNIDELYGDEWKIRVSSMEEAMKRLDRPILIIVPVRVFWSAPVPAARLAVQCQRTCP